MKVKILSAEDAVKCIKSGDTIVSDGFGWGLAFPEELAIAVEDRFLAEGEPRDLTLYFGAGTGDGHKRKKGFSHFGHEGLLKNVVTSHLAIVPELQQLIVDNKVAGYNLPLGVMAQLYRDAAGKKPGTITKVGMDTFMDPRKEGGKLNNLADHNVAELMKLNNDEYLFYQAPAIDVALLKGTYADTEGNITMDKEAVTVSALSIAQACKNNNGIVVVQVEDIVEHGTLDPKKVVIPGLHVDIIVKAENPKNHMQNFYVDFEPAFISHVKSSEKKEKAPMSTIKYIIVNRAYQELKPGMVINLGIGTPGFVADIAAEKGTIDQYKFTVEVGVVGGELQSDTNFGLSKNPDAIIDMASMFDFYHGGGLDITFLGFREVDQYGNVNVSRMGSSIPGVGGFVDISQNTDIVVFCSAFNAKGLDVEIDNGKLNIKSQGTVSKFSDQVEQISFSGSRALKEGKKVLYITERAVFQLTAEGMELIEYAPGVDIEKEIIPYMNFKPMIRDPKLMDLSDCYTVFK